MSDVSGANRMKLTAELREFYWALQQHGRAVKARDGVTRLRQLTEMVMLRVGPGKLTARDYYRMQVYRRDLSLWRKRAYVSNQALSSREPEWSEIANDKLICYLMLAAHGVRVPEVLAICHKLRVYLNRPAIRDAEAVAIYLAQHARYPFISKPVAGVFSNGFAVLEEYDSKASMLRLGDGSRISLDDFSQECMRWRRGVLFQELLVPHPDIATAFGHRVCTLRLIVILHESGPRLFRALWKIVAGGNMADNYWRPGNILARLDRDTGVIEQCTTGLGPNMRVVDRHPDTGRVLKGFRVPCYEEAVNVTLRAARVFSGLNMQAWDIAVTPDGAVPLEVNDVGSLFLPQMADQRGLYEVEEFRAFIRRLLPT
jgi:hypothetical protein